MKRLPQVVLFLCVPCFFNGCEKLEPEPEPEPINRAPTAKIQASVKTGERPLKVDFDASSSSDPEAGVLSYSWEFGNGTSSSSISPSKTYNESGAYEVILTVTDEGGLTDTDQITIKVDEPPDLFPLSEEAQWVYLVKSTDMENGKITGYEEGLTYLTVTRLDKESKFISFITLRVTGKKYYNEKLLGDYIYLAHVPGKRISVAHNPDESYSNMIDLENYSWNDFAMFFSQSSSQSVSMTKTSISIGLGTFSGYMVNYHRDNFGENYVTERFRVSEKEFLDPDIGLIYRETSRYVDFLDCFTCPVYTGSLVLELVGYYIPQENGTILEGGYGYNPSNPYGGNLGMFTIWANEDIGYTYVYLDGEYVGAISNYWPEGLNCDQPRALNVTRPDGTYSLVAESTQGHKWESTLTFTEGTCDKIRLGFIQTGPIDRPFETTVSRR